MLTTLIVVYRPRPHYVRWGPSCPCPKGAQQPPLFSPCLLWPNGWMDQDATGNEGGPRYRRHCVRLGPSPHRKGHSSPPLFGPRLGPNGWMDPDTTWYGGRPWTRRHCVRWGPSPSRKGA